MPRSTQEPLRQNNLHTQSGRLLSAPPESLACADYSLVRVAQRFVPKGMVTVTVGERGFPLALGEVRDLSESGACMVTDCVLGRSRILHLQLNLDDQGTIETEGQIVWSGEGKGWEPGAVVGAVLQGVEFLNLSPTLRRRLQDLLASGAFELVPGRSVGVRARNPFQELLEELQPALAELGSKFSPL